ncbi:MAG: tRNA (N(6)-L-threonylcarbamoyladenosine(37)-C(2))-methylthiotransferase MtaB [Chlamydiae bacterium]|jgi:threonylcarbamoyladenosine tRNA methylthiotransferase MtaB|nr:tRNA (N(6)-L-threonylcarbamoyladenosine(37)-C(2))-methylthiotransferase MtaB [Chlamydiota bacterium]
MKTFKIVTLGCRTNQYESQAYRDQLLKMGWKEAENDQASLCIVNTCTVTDSADQSSRYQIKQLAKKNPEAKIFVTGCLAERDSKNLKTLPQVEEVISNLKKETLLNIIFQDETVPEFKIERFEAHTRAFIKVQDGCNSFCSYCIIPYVRGRSRSKKIEEVVCEVEGLIQNGFKEIVLTGINIGDFDGQVEEGKPPKRLSDLVKAIDQIPGLERLRISSIDPDEVDEDLLEAIANGQKTCPSMHIVLQSGSNTVLKRMNRKYTKQQFFQAIERLKKVRKEFTFTTDVIVGFPQESEEEFNETVEVLKEVKFAKVHMFPYSVRPGTRAARMTGHLLPSLISERKEKVLRLAEQMAYELRNEFIGKRMKVLLESTDENQEFIYGHTENFLQVKIPKQNHRQNEIVEVLLKENTPECLIGKVVSCC